MGQILLREAHAGILHAQDDFGTNLFGPDFDAAAGGGELQSIELKVKDHFLQLIAIRQNPGRGPDRRTFRV